MEVHTSRRDNLSADEKNCGGAEIYGTRDVVTKVTTFISKFSSRVYRKS